MPFTLSHPAAVVPLARIVPRREVLLALVVGSMAPDFEYFVYLRSTRTIGHDPDGILLMDVPAGLVVLWLFEHLMRRPLARLLPEPHRRLWWREPPLAFLPAGRLLTLAAALAVGAFSHIAWDSFTHQDSWGVRHVPALETTLRVAGSALPAWSALQHASTLVGAALLIGWYRRWARAQDVASIPPVPPLPDRLRIGLIGLVAATACGAGLASCLVWWHHRGGLVGGSVLVQRFVIAAMSATFCATLAYGIAARLLDGMTTPSTSDRRPRPLRETP
jgi:hypothetical protein